MNINEYLNEYKIGNIEHETYIEVLSTFKLPDVVNVNKVLDVWGNVFICIGFKMSQPLNVTCSVINYSNTKITPGTYVGDYYYHSRSPDVFNSTTYLHIGGYFTDSGVLS